MSILAGLGGLLLILIIIEDVIETIVLPRRVLRRMRLTVLFYRSTWAPWLTVAKRIRSGRYREGFLSLYGPLSLIVLLIVWAGGLVLGFALLLWALGSPLLVAYGRPSFGTDLYMSGTTFFTLGLGDVTPQTALAKGLTVVEVAMGFGLLALVIGYLPVLYQAFSRREVNVTLLDARAGSPPSAMELFRRYGKATSSVVTDDLRNWERWTGELMESLLSYPLLAYFRSQHENQSWLTALTAILDVCALIIAGIEADFSAYQARLTFAIARHAVVDLSQVLGVQALPPNPDRLPPEELAQLRAELAAVGLHFAASPQVDQKLAHLRAMYEPYVNALSQLLLLPLPAWLPTEEVRDYWQREL
jgi:hypothetical protein